MTDPHDEPPAKASRFREFRPLSQVGAVALSGSVTVVVLLPLFLTGALGVQLTDDLAFGSVALGGAVAAHRFAASLSSPFLGRLVDGLGGLRSLRLGVLMASISSLGIATTVNRWSVLVGWLLLSGTALGVCQPAANRMLSQSVKASRLGTAFGLKQAAPPVASMLAGLSVPFIGVTFGWRFAYLGAALAGIPAAILIGRAPPRRPRTSKSTANAKGEPLPDRAGIVLLAVAFGLATSTSASLTTFYVVSSVSFGSTPEVAGGALAVASLTAVFGRIIAGIISDRITFHPLHMCAGMLLVGALGTVLVATGDSRWMAIGVAVGLAFSWGFNGAFWYVLVRSYPKSPGRITGAVAPGGLLGAACGPIAFGALVEQFGYTTAWLVAAAVAVVAAVMMSTRTRRMP